MATAPLTSNACVGLVVPIPTFPLTNKLEMLVVAKEDCPVTDKFAAVVVASKDAPCTINAPDKVEVDETFKTVILAAVATTRGILAVPVTVKSDIVVVAKVEVALTASCPNNVSLPESSASPTTVKG